MNNFRYDPALGIGKAACRRIPCARLNCLEMLKTSWDIDLNDKEQPQYGVNERYLYHRKFKEYNNLIVVDLVTTNVTS